jgi:hypothetical protein
MDPSTYWAIGYFMDRKWNRRKKIQANAWRNCS